MKPTTPLQTQKPKPVLIEAEKVISVRHEVLRKGKPLETAHFDGDTHPEAFHLGVYLNDQIVAVASYLPHKHPHFDKNEKQFQLRGMAVLPHYRGQDLGKKMYKEALKLLKSKNVDVLWFNARANAFAFYEKLGTQKIGKPFFIPEIGEHSLMYQKIKR